MRPCAIAATSVSQKGLAEEGKARRALARRLLEFRIPASRTHPCGGWACAPDLCLGGDAQALGQLVPLGSTHRCASTCGLSTWSSATALRGCLISGRVSRLDAFSAYLLRTQLPGGASGDATGAPLVRPARSSRTKASPPQASDARNR